MPDPTDKTAAGDDVPVSHGKTRRGYVPVRDYAAIGDCHGGALVARDGSIDWCCLRRFDAEPVFARLLDSEQGGYCSVQIVGECSITRAYEAGTHILRTEFRSAGGCLILTDFMPVARARGAGPYAYTDLVAPGWIVRRIEATEGEIEVECAWRPSSGFSLAPAALRTRENGVETRNAPCWLHSDIPFTIDEAHAVARTTLSAGERRYLVMGDSGHPPEFAHIDAVLDATRAFWKEWLAYSRYKGPYAAQVERSALTLKLLTYSPTGASVAALTTSLPEELGGERNWDYRFCWIRDASLGSSALSALGYGGEAQELYDFLRKPLHGRPDELQVMYGLEGELDLAERVLPDWDGYLGSRPVRSGNAAFRQRQSDLYGYLFEGAWIHKALGGTLTSKARKDLIRVVDFLAECWREPDMGLWEIRGPPRHFVHSKAMCWVAVQRAIDLIGERPQWIELRMEIWDAIHSQGMVDGHFVQSFGERDGRVVDAALLQLPLLGLPVDMATITATRKMIESELRNGDFVRRYYGCDDGVKGQDGAFLPCSFWLVDCLLVEGEIDQGTALFERLLTHANDLGLYAEETDPNTNAFLGNFPQAFTHFSLINSAVNLELCREHGPEGLVGDYAERTRRSAWATHGWRGMIAHVLRSGRRNLLSSHASQWPRHVQVPKSR
ncbi:MAG: glycoside hydrolase family 15 protein [Pseudomonadota bacterium]|nr:glycoside hydrolase family 15 protein [Pseudomonadota bacterium]